MDYNQNEKVGFVRSRIQGETKMNETVRIEGKQIALRPITLEDTPLIVRWRSDPQVYGTLFRQEPITEERHRQWLREMVLSGKCDQFIICLLYTSSTPP